MFPANTFMITHSSMFWRKRQRENIKGSFLLKDFAKKLVYDVGSH
jgi:hypothetical protein